MPPGEAAHAVSPGRGALAGASGLGFDLGEARQIDAVVFEVDEADWVARPRLGLSLDGQHWTDVEAVASLADATLSLMKDPRHGRGEIRFATRNARYVRLDPRLPARPGTLQSR